VEVDSIQPINKRRLAIIDCGTNTFNLLVVDHHDSAWELVFSNKMPVKIGSGGFEEAIITEARMVRAIDVLVHYQQVVKMMSVDEVKVVATSAVRDASNKARFNELVRKYTGWEVAVISGDGEATLIYEGVKQSGDLGPDPVLIMDIGGGSTEWIIANHDTMFWKKSYPLGVSRLFEKLAPEERLSRENMNELRKMLDLQLVDLKAALAEFPCQHLIGASGSFDTLLDIFSSANADRLKFPNPNLQEIPLSAFPAMHIWLLGSTLKERMNHPAIPSIRAEYMPVSSFLIQYVLEISNCSKIFRSAFALKEGLIQNVLLNKEMYIE
jgi:exopolyphosphatase / guanosine-5'-triphosphate,3'-diphosphate pyrophosphatase